MQTQTWPIRDLAHTEALALALGRLCGPHTVLALNGGLGAGKTHFVRALARGLRVNNPAAVNSPTFVLIQEYPGPLPLYHFDAYRLCGPVEFQELGVDEYFAEPAVCVVEWAERVEAALPDDRLTIAITVTGEASRTWNITPTGKRHTRLYNSWLDALRAEQSES
jgi:tRNA threonylcarbamoyladenosine biosynthesis protein TsaE